MSENETPVDANPSSGGAPASPSEAEDPDDLPPPPLEPHAAGDEAGTGSAAPPPPPSDPNVEFARAMLSRTDLDDDRGGGGGAGDVDDEGDFEGEDEDEGMDDMMSVLHPAVIRRVERLKDLNVERDSIMEEYLAERAALERKFAAKCEPLYGKRSDVILGKLDDEIEAAAGPEKEGGGEGEGEQDDDEEPPAGIPQFWVCAMGHMEAVAELVTERDVDCLDHLIDITCADDEDGKGFTLRFHFGPNDYFSDAVLSKRYEIPNLVLDDEPILKNVTGCDIHWKEGMSLTYREVKKKQRSKSGKRAGQIRTVVKKERTDSFFHFFSPPKMPSMDDMDEEEADALEEAFDHDYDVAQAFRSHIVPKAVLWFTGEALDEDMEALIEDGEWGGAENEDDGADGGMAAAGSSPFPPPAEGGGENPECKQN